MSQESALIPTARRDSAGQWFNASDPLITLPADSSGTPYITCSITVPYAHRLLKAFICALDVDKTGTHTSSLFQGDDGDAKLGTIVGSAVVQADSSGTVQVDEVTLAAADKVETTGARSYWLSLLGTDANDLLHMPNLSILVQPVTRSTL